MLGSLLEMADDGNPAAMEALVRLSFEMEIAAALKRPDHDTAAVQTETRAMTIPKASSRRAGKIAREGGREAVAAEIERVGPEAFKAARWHANSPVR